MKIELTRVGKRFNREWIFRNLSFCFTAGGQYAITGPNGSGKSTLLQVIAGSSLLSEGTITYDQGNTAIDAERVFSMISFSAPYLELVEEMTLGEFLHFHHTMKGWIPALDNRQIVQVLNLESSAHKQLRYFSSGMKQRVKLAQAVFSNVPVVLLDEPTTNLDEEGIALYKTLIENYCSNRLLIISSNDKEEYSFCKETIDLRKYQ
jgi:ABC-type multidrug transport system ATPase subunit